MLKVAKFGGSSMADAKQFEKVRDIVRADPARKVIVVSAAGKRSADDHKLTDLLYLCYAHLQYGVNCDAVFQMICDRYIAIRDECGLNVDIEAELDVLRRQMRAGISEEELVSRGEYFSALLMADYLGYSFLDAELSADPKLALGYIAAPPRMAYYMEYSTKIYDIYLKYIAPEDMHIYSVDEVFVDVTDYLSTYEMTARELAMTMIQDVLKTTGITATAGIGTNMYLCKIAMDVVAKHMDPDKNGVRIAALNEMSYRKLLWNHRPLTDFWRVGPGYAKKLEANGLYTMGDIARCSIGKPDELYNEELLYQLFGVNAELLIDHAWGYEPCTIQDVKAYKPETNSVSSGQVLQCPYDFDKAKLVVKEMTDLMVLDLVDKRLVTDQIVLTIGYDIVNLTDPSRNRSYKGVVTTDRYGRKVPKHAHGTTNLKRQTSSTAIIMDAVMELYDRIVDKKLLVRRITITANKLVSEDLVQEKESYEQLQLFTDYEEVKRGREKEEAALEKEKRIQHAMLDIKKKFGKNAILKGMNLEEGATAKDRNSQIGGHKA